MTYFTANLSSDGRGRNRASMSMALGAKCLAAALLSLTPSFAFAQETRQLDAHEHGVGQLNIAFDGATIAMEFHAPGADIVGFEYEAKSSEDRRQVDDAVARLARPLDLFVLPAAAGCGVVEAAAALESDTAHDTHEDHDHESHDHEGHDHDAHKDEDHADHEGGHTHGERAGHSEFHAEYLIECADPARATLISFAYFDAFPNAREVEVQVITDTGATAFEVEKDARTVDLRELF